MIRTAYDARTFGDPRGSVYLSVTMGEKEMELLLITENKLKIMLSREDLDAYGITFEGIDYDNTETRRVFWSLLDEAKQKTGFDAAISKIFIQIYPDRSGGCEMYVSRLSGEDGRKRGVTCRVGDSPMKRPERRLFVFESLDRLLALCRALRGTGLVGGSAAYSERREGTCRCFLLAECESAAVGRISEYGDAADSDKLLYYINEHCKVICAERAVEVLGAL